MAPQDTDAVSDWMQETYPNTEFFQVYAEMFTPLLNDLEECPDEPIHGKGWNVPLYENTPWNVRTGPEGGGQPSVESDDVVQGRVLNQQFQGVVQLTELLERQGTKDAHFNGGALDHQMKQVSQDVSKLMQIHFWGHGTGRLMVIDQTEVTETHIKCRISGNGRQRIKEKMRVQVYDTDTGGTKQGTGGTKTYMVKSIDRASKGDPGGAGYNTYSGIVELEEVDGGGTLPENFTAGHGVYLKDDYGYAPNGIDGLIGSATIAPTFLGVSRADHPKLNTNRLHASGTPRDLTYDLMIEACDAMYDFGMELDSIRMNVGVMNKYAALAGQDKRYPIVKGDFPKLIGGYREGDLLFAYDKATATVKKDPQCAPRTALFLAFKDTFYKHTTAELGFLNRGGNILLPVVSADGTGYDTAIQARLYAAVNLSNKFPLGNARLEDVKDSTLAGD